MVLSHYPTGLRWSAVRSDWSIEPGRAVEPDRFYGAGRYLLDCRPYRPVAVDLIDGGKTLPVKTDRQPIPCPKVRKGTETRYLMGHWQKYTKTKGWVSA